ncbi:MAG: aminotransferase class V-fold PLP-dependent enzyme [Flavobacteriaceae bacterium]|nr:aminotransferase class V-fold PLP-dependent enzyme [Flavobacteriaceae bacterium]
MLQNQQHLFSLNDEITYLNGAYMSPQLKSVAKIGIDCLQQKSQPSNILAADFFSEKEVLRSHFAQLISVDDPQRIAILPSVSFGIGTAMKNIPFEKGDEIVVLEEQFPSNYYAWQQLELEKGVVIKTISAPPLLPGRGQLWNEHILEAITPKTKCVALPMVHWADGTKFDLQAVRSRTNEVNAYLIIDGTQSVGALPFSVKEIQPDALICAGYKWLMGAYGLGIGYFGERFDDGTPLDNNWMNHQDAEDFSKLVNYNHSFKPKAARYDIGESSNFIMVPMLTEGIRQLITWTQQGIQTYCEAITKEAIEQLTQQKGCFVEDSNYRGQHLFGIYLPESMNIYTVKTNISAQNILVSIRGNAIRVSPNVYNNKKHLEKLVSCFI